MFAANADADTERALHQARMLEAALAAIGAVDGYEAVAQAIADGAHQIVGTILVTLTVPTADGGGTLIVASGGMTPEAADDGGVDQLPVMTFSLSTERDGDETLPVLHLHGRLPEEALGLALLRRFASHACLALARAQHLADMTRLAFSDPLTGLANLRGLQNALEREATLANAEGRSLALLIIDLDDFRRYNTLWGHLVGDAALQALAHAIRDATHSTDFVARVGGEEFAVLLPDSGESEARTVAAHIHDAIATGSAGLPSPFTASIGIGIYPNDVPDAFSLYAVADTAMTMAKKAGKNRTFAFEAMGGPRR
jgi:diguanylate cyclase (GGDEF)-like protein